MGGGKSFGIGSLPTLLLLSGLVVGLLLIFQVDKTFSLKCYHCSHLPKGSTCEEGDRGALQTCTTSKTTQNKERFCVAERFTKPSNDPYSGKDVKAGYVIYRRCLALQPNHTTLGCHPWKENTEYCYCAEDRCNAYDED